MTEWGVVAVLVVLIGLITSIVKPILALNTSITKLAEAVDHLQDTQAKYETKTGEQEKTLSNHETRITVLEKDYEKNVEQDSKSN